MSAPARTVTLHAELGRLADATGEDRLLRVWYGLRALDPNGTGWLDNTPDTIAALLCLGVAPSERQLKTYLKQGEGVYWRRVTHHDGPRPELRRPVIQLAGLKKITRHLTERTRSKDVPHSHGDPGAGVAVSVGQLGGSLAEWRAVLFKVWLDGQAFQQTRMPWTRMCELWGRASLNTMKARCKLAGVEVAHNYIALPVSTQSPDKGNMPLAPKGAKQRQIDGETCHVWQTWNTFKTNGQHAPRGMRRKVRSEVRDALNLGLRAYTARRWFDDPAKFAKARNRRPHDDMRLLSGVIHGKAHLWMEYAGITA